MEYGGLKLDYKMVCEEKERKDVYYFLKTDIYSNNYIN